MDGDILARQVARQPRERAGPIEGGVDSKLLPELPLPLVGEMRGAQGQAGAGAI